MVHPLHWTALVLCLAGASLQPAPLIELPDLVESESSWIERSFPMAGAPWRPLPTIMLALPGVSDSREDSLWHIAHRLPAAGLSVVTHVGNGPVSDAVHHVKLFSCDEIPDRDQLVYNRVPCAGAFTERRQPPALDDPNDHTFAVRGGYLVCQVHFKVPVHNERSGCLVQLADRWPDPLFGERTPVAQHMLDISLLALPPRMAGLHLKESWKYTGPSKQIRTMYLHQHSRGRGGRLKISSAGESSQQWVSKYDRHTFSQELCDSAQGSDCGQLKHGDLLQLECKFDTTVDQSWVTYGMANGEMCLLWIMLAEQQEEPAANSADMRQLAAGLAVFEPHWQVRLVKSEPGAANLTRPMISVLGRALGVSIPDKGPLQPLLLQRVHAKGLALFMVDEIDLSKLSRAIQDGEGTGAPVP